MPRRNSCGLRQETRLNNLIDGDGREHSGLLFVGIAQAEIRKYVSPAWDNHPIILSLG